VATVELAFLATLLERQSLALVVVVVLDTAVKEQVVPVVVETLRMELI
jgi:hypothetical protein